MELPCQCGIPQRRATEPDFPIVYDSRMDEYSIVHGGTQTGKGISGKALMRYCFWCDGALPSKPSTFFTMPGEDDVSDMKRLMAQVQTTADMRRVLGEPNYTYIGGLPSELVDLQTKPEDLWENQHAYQTRWQTLELRLS